MDKKYGNSLKALFYITTFIILKILLLSCGASTGINFSTEKLEQLKIGVTNRQFVDSELQIPYSKEKVSFKNLESTIYFYNYSQMPLGSLKRIDKKEFYLEFMDDILNGKLFNYSFDTSNDFNLEKRDKLILNQSNKQDIIALFGDYNGEFLLPSNFLNMISKDEYAVNIPEDADKVIIYYYSYLKKVTSSFNEFVNHKKFLLLYLNKDELLIKVLFDESETK